MVTIFMDVGSNPDEVTSTTVPTTTTTTPASEPEPAPAPSTKPLKVPTTVFGASNQPQCQCFCQAPLSSDLSNPSPNFVSNRPSFAQNQPNFVPVRSSTSPRFLAENNQPLFVRKSNRRDSVRMIFNVNQQEQQQEKEVNSRFEGPLFVKPSQRSEARNPINLDFQLFV